MPLVIECDESEIGTLEEVVEHLHQGRFDPGDHDSFREAAPLLKRLANNRSFLAELACKELKNYRSLQEGNEYSPQVFMLYPPQRRGQSFFMRACFWPAEHDQVVKTSGTDPFFYHKPHDHNFNFLTVGYHGPGYWSDYYEYSYGESIGYKGEAVDLRFIEKKRLDQGMVMLYRAFTDIHDQLPADSFSVSLNIMENTLRSSVMDQYAFDVDASKITGIVNRVSCTALFHVVAAFEDSDAEELLTTIYRRHPLDRVRLSALQALASAKSTPAAAIEVYSRVSDGDPEFLRAWRRVRTSELEQVAR